MSLIFNQLCIALHYTLYMNANYLANNNKFKLLNGISFLVLYLIF